MTIKQLHVTKDKTRLKHKTGLWYKMQRKIFTELQNRTYRETTHKS